MKIYAPDYYSSFSCIADKCAHSCCIGWEIDIDDETLEYYKSVQSDFGKRLLSGISYDGGDAHFALTKDERCPFLTNGGLCEIILKLGENALCGICSDHPRYRSFFSARTEIGIGMCCEEAARIILTREDKTKLVLIADDGEDSVCTDEEEIFFAFRSRLFAAAQDRTKPIAERIKNILAMCGAKMPDNSVCKWAEIYLALEHLEDGWTDMLNKLKNVKSPLSIGNISDMALEQLLVYFLYRHTADGIYDGRLRERIVFSVVSVCMIDELTRVCGTDSLFEIARRYSAEIEYCEENIAALLNAVTG